MILKKQIIEKSFFVFFKKNVLHPQKHAFDRYLEISNKLTK